MQGDPVEAILQGEGPGRGADVLSNDELIDRIKQDNLTDVALGGGAGVWMVSSAKHGNGVANLLDHHNLDTYWQSDGLLPHVITILLNRLTAVETVCVYFDFKRDESYTPRVVKLSAGTHEGDMAEVAFVDMNEVTGWVMMDVVGDAAAPAEQPVAKDSSGVASRGRGASGSRDQPQGVAAEVFAQSAAQETTAADQRVWCTRLTIEFLENYQNGRDCHVRGVRVLGPRTVSAFTNPTFTQHLIMR